MAVINLDPENVPEWQDVSYMDYGTVHKPKGKDDESSNWFSSGILKAAGVFGDAYDNANTLNNTSEAQATQFIANAMQHEMQALSHQGQIISLGAQKVNYEYQAKLARLNGQVGQRQLYQIYRQGEWQAMAQGVVDAEKIAQTRARTASRGVRLGQGSAALIEQTERMAAYQNQKAIQISTTNAAVQQRAQIANNYAQAYIAEGNVKATEYNQQAQTHLIKSQQILADAAREIASINLKYAHRISNAQIFNGAIQGIGSIFTSFGGGVGTAAKANATSFK